jgi:hypothetical protein
MDRLVRARHRLAALDAWLLRQALKSRTPTNDRVLRTASQRLPQFSAAPGAVAGGVPRFAACSASASAPRWSTDR